MGRGAKRSGGGGAAAAAAASAAGAGEPADAKARLALLRRVRELELWSVAVERGLPVRVGATDHGRVEAVDARVSRAVVASGAVVELDPRAKVELSGLSTADVARLFSRAVGFDKMRELRHTSLLLEGAQGSEMTKRKTSSSFPVETTMSTTHPALGRLLARTFPASDRFLVALSSRRRGR